MNQKLVSPKLDYKSAPEYQEGRMAYLKNTCKCPYEIGDGDNKRYCFWMGYYDEKLSKFDALQEFMGLGEEFKQSNRIGKN